MSLLFPLAPSLPSRPLSHIDFGVIIPGFSFPVLSVLTHVTPFVASLSASPTPVQCSSRRYQNISTHV